jgi:uncharacterized protein (TIGR03000 family)
VVRLRAGSAARLSFDFEQPQPIETRLTVRLPEEAQVTLAGASTTSTGPVRVFSTTALKPGQVWSDYTVEVTWQRAGRSLSKTETIDLQAGQERTLTFDFDEQIAAAP